MEENHVTVVMDFINTGFGIWEVNDLEPCWVVKVNAKIKRTLLI